MSDTPESTPETQKLLPENSTPINEGLVVDQEGEWEVLLADPPVQPPLEIPPPQALIPPSDSIKSWVKIIFPIAVILVYLIYKMVSGGSDRESSVEFDERRDLVDVKLPPSSEEELKRQERKALEDLVSQLNFAFQARDYSAVQEKISAAPERLQKTEIVRTFGLLSRVQAGAREPSMNKEIAELRPYLTKEKDKRLLAALDLAEAKIILHHSSPEYILRHTPRLRALIGNAPTLTQDVLQIRIQLALKFEEIADKEADEAGFISQDQVRLANARTYYQQALRWVTTKEGWLKLTPLDDGLSGQISNRIQVKLRRANERFHGPSLPFTNRDRTTWSGLSGEPLHDIPGGAW